MKLDERDKARLLLAAIITVIALPTIWLLNRDDDGPGAARPNVAAVGMNPGEADAASDVRPATGGVDPMGTGGAAYLESRPTVAPSETPSVAYGTVPGVFVGNTEATYRNSDIPNGQCRYNGITSGTKITVINVANGQSVTCRSSLLGDGVEDGLVMNAAQFREIAELVSAPIHVEVRR